MKRLLLEWRDYFLTRLVCLLNPGTYLLWVLWVTVAMMPAALVWKHHHSVPLSVAVGIGTFLVATLIAFTISKWAGRWPPK